MSIPFLYHHPATGLADRAPRTVSRTRPMSQRDRVAASLLVRPDTADAPERPLRWPRL